MTAEADEFAFIFPCRHIAEDAAAGNARRLTVWALQRAGAAAALAEYSPGRWQAPRGARLRPTARSRRTCRTAANELPPPGRRRSMSWRSPARWRRRSEEHTSELQSQ